jgi:hypothetical protein
MRSGDVKGDDDGLSRDSRLPTRVQMSGCMIHHPEPTYSESTKCARHFRLEVTQACRDRWTSCISSGALQSVPPDAKELTKHEGRRDYQHFQSSCHPILRTMQYSICRRAWYRSRCDVTNATNHSINVSCWHAFDIGPQYPKPSSYTDQSGSTGSTLTRHGYYCRSRRVGRTVRRRSCIACAKSKARCDNGQPSCSRCTVKAVQCYYPDQATSTAPSTTVGPSEKSRPGLSSMEDPVATSDNVNIDLDNIPASESEQQLLGWNNMELASLGQDVDWENLTLDVADFLNDQTNITKISHPVSSVNHSLQMQHALSLNNIPVLSIPNIYSPRSLVPRPGRDPGQQRIANLVLQTLKSYPLMIIRHNTLPPFVHPYSTEFDGEEVNTESMTNCLNLMHMLGSKIRGSSKLFWKNVRWECERMREQVSVSILSFT